MNQNKSLRDEDTLVKELVLIIKAFKYKTQTKLLEKLYL